MQYGTCRMGMQPTDWRNEIGFVPETVVVLWVGEKKNHVLLAEVITAPEDSDRIERRSASLMLRDVSKYDTIYGWCLPSCMVKAEDDVQFRALTTFYLLTGLHVNGHVLAVPDKDNKQIWCAEVRVGVECRKIWTGT